MAYPKVDRTTKIVIVPGKDGAMLYGNTGAFRTLARWMTWLAESDPRDHYEMHVPWHLQSPLSRTQRIEVLREGRSGRYRRAKDFEMTFMVLGPGELRKISRSAASRKKKKGRRRS